MSNDRGFDDENTFKRNRDRAGRFIQQWGWIMWKDRRPILKFFRPTAQNKYLEDYAVASMLEDLRDVKYVPTHLAQRQTRYTRKRDRNGKLEFNLRDGPFNSLKDPPHRGPNQPNRKQ